MATISITTTQNIELEYDLAGLGQRIAAGIIDLIIIVAYIFIVSAILGNIGGLGGWIYFLSFFPVYFYTILCESFLNGQTVGKMALSVKAISLDGNQPTFAQYIIRWLFRLVDIWITSFLGAIVSIAVTEKQQRIGDLVAGTTVVRTKAKTALSQTLYAPVVENNYKAMYPEVINLSDKDMQLIKDVLTAHQKGGNPMMTFNTMRRIEEILNIKNQHEDPAYFLYQLIQDYNALASKL